MQIVIVKSPKLFSGILRKLFGIKKESYIDGRRRESPERTWPCGHVLFFWRNLCLRRCILLGQVEYIESEHMRMQL